MKHVDLTSLEKGGRFLVMCSDGLTDLYMHDDDRKDLSTLEEIADAIVLVVSNRPTVDGNAALHLLRDAVGGSDEDKVSRNLTVEMAFRWMDDTTILVHSL